MDGYEYKFFFFFGEHVIVCVRLTHTYIYNRKYIIFFFCYDALIIIIV